jgi:beta-aspartyl-peptidase (threonine type)
LLFFSLTLSKKIFMHYEWTTYTPDTNNENKSHFLLPSSHLDEKFRVLIHGGAWDIPDSLKNGHRDGVHEAYQVALQGYQDNLPPLNIISNVLVSLENNPIFDAGKGSFLNENGEVELDAAVMEGKQLRAGAVTCVRNFLNPSLIALKVLEKNENVLLAGLGAEQFAEREGFNKVDPKLLVDPRELEAHKNWLKAGKPNAKTFFSSSVNKTSTGHSPEKRGTVGVVIGIKNQNNTYSLYSGTSTGGTPGKRYGRVGDVPLVGCGLYADNETASVSCTGWGEGLTRVSAAKAVCERIRAKMHPQAAIESVLEDLHRRTDGRGGIIAIDYKGQMGAAFSTPDMAYIGHTCTALNTN